jgi:hypothetical protein
VEYKAPVVTFISGSLGAPPQSYKCAAQVIGVFVLTFLVVMLLVLIQV